MCLIRVGGLCEMGGTVGNTLKGGETEKRGRETKILKRGSKLGQWVGALKRGTGTPLQTIVLKIMARQQSIDCHNNICDYQRASLNSHRDYQYLDVTTTSRLFCNFF